MAPFAFSNNLTLWVVPFDLERGQLLALPGELPIDNQLECYVAS